VGFESLAGAATDGERRAAVWGCRARRAFAAVASMSARRVAQLGSHGRSRGTACRIARRRPAGRGRGRASAATNRACGTMNRASAVRGAG